MEISFTLKKAIKLSLNIWVISMVITVIAINIGSAEALEVFDMASQFVGILTYVFLMTAIPFLVCTFLIYVIGRRNTRPGRKIQLMLLQGLAGIAMTIACIWLFLTPDVAIFSPFTLIPAAIYMLTVFFVSTFYFKPEKPSNDLG